VSELRRRSSALIKALDLPATFDLSLLLERIEARRGRPILVMALPTEGTECGSWYTDGQRDIIVYEKRTTAFHGMHIVLHELGHLAFGHDREPDGVDAEQVRVQVRDGVAPITLTRISRRGSQWSRDQERERQAELLATMLGQRLHRADLSSSVAVNRPNVAAQLDRLANGLEAPSW
jgi:hypothetical protein